MSWEVREGDCVEAMRAMPEASVDSIVCDPPYMLGFMGKAWDTLTPGDVQHGHDRWAREALRVLKPGGHLLAFGGTRTYHRLACAIEDAGFEIRDCLAWLYGSGFPKSLSPYRSMLSGLCRSTEHARRAVRISEWHPVASQEAKGPTALALVEILPEGELGVAIRTGGGVDTFARTVMPSSVLKTVGMSLSTESSWLNCLDATLDGTSMSITETASRLTTDPRIWNCYRSLSTPPSITPDEWRPDGCSCDAWSAVESLNGAGAKWSATPLLIAPASATARVVPTKPLGSALKPSHEPIVMARKPLAGTVAANVLEHGTGALNVDGCRIDTTAEDVAARSARNGREGQAPSRLRDSGWGMNAGEGIARGEVATGRWPANVLLAHTEECVPAGIRRVKSNAPAKYVDNGAEATLYGDGMGKRKPGDVRGGFADADGMETVQAWECHPECPVRMLDEQTGEMTTHGGGVTPPVRSTQSAWADGSGYNGSRPDAYRGDSGGASRFLYVAKASSAERNAGLEGFEEQSARWGGTIQDGRPHMAEGYKYEAKRANVHPTVKPIELMRWLVRLVTPSGGTVLDPFTGSGTTGCAAVLERLNFIGIEREAEYVAIARARIAWWEQHPEGLEIVKSLEADRVRRAVADSGQLGLLG